MLIFYEYFAFCAHKSCRNTVLIGILRRIPPNQQPNRIFVSSILQTNRESHVCIRQTTESPDLSRPKDSVSSTFPPKRKPSPISFGDGFLQPSAAFRKHSKSRAGISRGHIKTAFDIVTLSKAYAPVKKRRTNHPQMFCEIVFCRNLSALWLFWHVLSRCEPMFIPEICSNKCLIAIEILPPT